MRSVQITDEDQLGPFKHDKRLKVGETQAFTFQEDDDGPCWMTPEKQKLTSVDVFEEEQVKYCFNMKELRSKLQEKGHPFNGRKAELEKRCSTNGIQLFEMRRRIKTKGWKNRPKGMLQILWERGFIDPRNRSLEK